MKESCFIRDSQYSGNSYPVAGGITVVNPTSTRGPVDIWINAAISVSEILRQLKGLTRGLGHKWEVILKKSRKADIWRGSKKIWRYVNSASQE
jgi:hypothetical protein